jgi:hypothetical protein
MSTEGTDARDSRDRTGGTAEGAAGNEEAEGEGAVEDDRSETARDGCGLARVLRCVMNWLDINQQEAVQFKRLQIASGLQGLPFAPGLVIPRLLR